MNKVFFTILISLMAAAAHAQGNPCKGTYHAVLAKDSTLVVPCPDMVLMNILTFAGYYDAALRLESLKPLIESEREKTDSLEALHHSKVSSLYSIIELKEMSKEMALREVVRLQGALKKEKFIRRILGGGMAVVVVAIILILI